MGFRAPSRVRIPPSPSRLAATRHPPTGRRHLRGGAGSDVRPFERAGLVRSGNWCVDRIHMFDRLPPIPTPGDDDPARWHLLRTVARVVADQGFDGATIEGIVARAGIPREEFDAAFATKQEA